MKRDRQRVVFSGSARNFPPKLDRGTLVEQSHSQGSEACPAFRRRIEKVRGRFQSGQPSVMAGFLAARERLQFRATQKIGKEQPEKSRITNLERF
ncbi:MAG: hypothetical protein WA854_11490, partial [Candidatus Binataceae bacterium]